MISILTCLFFSFPVLGKPHSVYILQRPIHTHGCHGIEVNYGISHEMHGGALGYVYHISPTWHMKLSGVFTNKKRLLVSNTYHWNLYNYYEATYLNLLAGSQGSYQFGDLQFCNSGKHFNIGIQLGLEVEQYITDILLLVLLAEFPISFLGKVNELNYRLLGGFRISF